MCCTLKKKLNYLYVIKFLWSLMLFFFFNCSNIGAFTTFHFILRCRNFFYILIGELHHQDLSPEHQLERQHLLGHTQVPVVSGSHHQQGSVCFEVWVLWTVVCAALLTLKLAFKFVFDKKLIFLFKLPSCKVRLF